LALTAISDGQWCKFRWLGQKRLNFFVCRHFLLSE